MNDKLFALKTMIERELSYGYGGDPYVHDLESEFKYDGRVEAYEDVLGMIEHMLEETA